MKPSIKQPHISRINTTHFSHLLLTFMLIISVSLIGCEGPIGDQGPQGPEGAQGPVGPAGEDGSAMYSGEGDLEAGMGANGDYYLNQNTGELYGPKDADGWGNPIIVLMGEDGQDGADGEDGSQIHSGSGAPDASLGKVGDYYLDKSSYELYGPKTGSGWGSPLNLKGADGNANVTRYIFPGHDFSSEGSTQKFLRNIEKTEESIWLVYLGTSGFKFPVPGYGPGTDTEYNQYHGSFNSGTAIDVRIRVVSGPGESFSDIIIVQIEPSGTENLEKIKAGETSILPNHLDVSDYEAVANYYGFYRK
ncbi:hypothetical protein [Fodinibius salsisoli]|uniref:Collagen-like protein n=1 Tax=Fodinibius salsisoli TaxID=2820877 RepID=A0ABT3PQW6_9BACT|nr:hypothetical protein [Fodinibius salsisoli]MCW9708245.1 collagen-like protein [Fodinibius salsisoli]